ncbi:hypothetical protein DNTS_015558 [Danionella cerebrum]|uniref:Uncharacterized protein n=1 Tax=Danionella cerebrum TaxID=2873325 RepID=A0A553MLE2_9TELE|nr:hypothetical protein DNTS_015558 [Danionella translucida]TRY54002.1 hypothetical protein DNTS_015558 [Danionella translucida]
MHDPSKKSRWGIIKSIHTEALCSVFSFSSTHCARALAAQHPAGVRARCLLGFGPIAQLQLSASPSRAEQTSSIPDPWSAHRDHRRDAEIVSLVERCCFGGIRLSGSLDVASGSRRGRFCFSLTRIFSRINPDNHHCGACFVRASWRRAYSCIAVTEASSIPRSFFIK